MSQRCPMRWPQDLVACRATPDDIWPEWLQSLSVSSCFGSGFHRWRSIGAFHHSFICSHVKYACRYVPLRPPHRQVRLRFHNQIYRISICLTLPYIPIFAIGAGLVRMSNLAAPAGGAQCCRTGLGFNWSWLILSRNRGLFQEYASTATQALTSLFCVRRMSTNYALFALMPKTRLALLPWPQTCL